jgi:argininosuccinate lyase
MTERKDDRLWGGRFEREPNAQFDAFQRSFAFDRRLLPYEIAVDRAWAKALEPIGIFTAAEVKQTLAALDKIAERVKTDSAWLESFGAGAEDVSWPPIFAFSSSLRPHKSRMPWKPY